MLNRYLATTAFGLGIILAPAFATAQSASPAQVDECSKEILLSYFPEPFVTPTLKKFNVPQDKWDAIVKGLAEKNKDVLRLVEEKASKLDPNPFKGFDPSQRAAAVKIFRETLTQVFGEVLKANGVTDDTQIAQMLEDIQKQKAANFAKCREKEMHNMQQSGQQPGQMQPQGTPHGQAQPQTSAPGYLSDASAPAPKQPYGAPKADQNKGYVDHDDNHDDHDDHDSDDDHSDEQRG